MTDEELANLLGQKPAAPDPAFRFDVFARVARTVQRRAARTRALNIIAISCGVGAFFAFAQASGFRIETAEPLFYTLAVVGSAYLIAQETIKGRRSPFARALAQFRFRL